MSATKNRSALAKMDNTLLRLLALIGPPLGLILGIFITLVVIKHYDKLRLLLSDILRTFGWLGKSIRRKSVETEYEGVINGVINEFNKNFETPILPNCEIQWINSENQQNYLEGAKQLYA